MEAEHLFCSRDCHCGLLPEYDAQAVGGTDNAILDEPDDKTTATGGSRLLQSSLADNGFFTHDEDGFRRLKVYTQDGGATDVSDCIDYFDDVYNQNDDARWQFEGVFAELEREEHCSGICNGVTDDKKGYDRFIFSNVNNGEPEESCREYLLETIEKHMDYFNRIYIGSLVISSVALFILTVLLIIQIYVWCVKKCRKDEQRAMQPRAANGMVVGQYDQEMEMGSQTKNPDRRA